MPSTNSKLKRGMDASKAQAVYLALNPKQVEIVNRLYEGGLHGNSCAEVVRRLFCDGCALHVEDASDGRKES